MSRVVVLALLFALGPSVAWSQTAVCQNKCGLFVSTGTVAKACSTYVWLSPNGCRTTYGCYCDDACLQYGDCCVGAVDTCMQPQLSNVSPTTLPTSGGTSLTLSGSHLGASTGMVALGTASCASTYWSDTKVIAMAPAGQGANLPVSVTTTGAKKSNALAVSYAAPAIQAISPSTEVAPNTVVTLTGANFGVSGGTVLVGKTAAAIQSQSHTQVKFVMPAGGGATTVQYGVGGQVSNSVSIA